MTHPLSIHFSNSAHFPILERALIKGGRFAATRLAARFGIIVHPTHGPVLIDAGCSSSIYEKEDPGLALKAYRTLLRPEVLRQGGPGIALARLGFAIKDVRHVILTHLHLDHVGYLHEFPGARIHVTGPASYLLRHLTREQLLIRGVFQELMPDNMRSRISVADAHRMVALPGGLGDGFDLFEDGSVIVVPLPGHAAGHAGVCLPTLERPVLYAADTAWTMKGLFKERERPLAVRMIADDARDAAESRFRVRCFAQAGGDVILCHDPDPTTYDLDDPGEGEA